MFTALPDGRVAIAHMAGPVDTVSASLYAQWLHDVAMAEQDPATRSRTMQEAATLRAVIRKAQINRNLRNQRAA